MANKQYTTHQRRMARRLSDLKQSDKIASRETKDCIKRHNFRSMIMNMIQNDLNQSK